MKKARQQSKKLIKRPRNLKRVMLAHVIYSVMKANGLELFPVNMELSDKVFRVASIVGAFHVKRDPEGEPPSENFFVLNLTRNALRYAPHWIIHPESVRGALLYIPNADYLEEFEKMDKKIVERLTSYYHQKELEKIKPTD